MATFHSELFFAARSIFDDRESELRKQSLWYPPYDILVEVRTMLTLSGREPVYKEIWSKISISKTQFDGWPVFATDFAASGEIADRFLRLGSK